MPECVEFKIALAISLPFFSEKEEISLTTKLLDEIAHLSGHFVAHDLKMDYELSTLPTEYVDKYKDEHKDFYEKFSWRINLFLFKISVPFYEGWKCDEDNGYHISAEDSFMLVMKSEMSFIIYRFSFALGITSFGLFDIGPSTIYVYDTKLKDLDGIYCDFSWVRNFNQAKYDCYGQIPLQETVDWLFSIEDVQNGCGKTPLGKSLSIFSRMFCEIGSETDFVLDGLLSVMALEALYESEGVRRDLVQRVSAFLEVDIMQVNDDVKNIYRHRSAIAHGGFVTPFNLCPYDGTKEFEKAFNIVGKNYWMGLQILLSSYRKMIKLNLKELKFKYVYY